MVKRNNSNSSNFIKLLQEKKWFLISVYLLLLFQLLITYYTVYFFRNNEKFAKYTDVSGWIYLIILIILLVIISLFKLPNWIRLIIFMLIAIVLGGSLHKLSKTSSEDFINQILIATISIFVSLSIVAFILSFLGYDLGWMNLYILYGLIALIIGYIILFLFYKDTKYSKTIYKYLMLFALVLFSFDILYSTNLMLNKDYDLDYISATIDLYLDIINIFTNLFGLESLEEL